MTKAAVTTYVANLRETLDEWVGEDEQHDLLPVIVRESVSGDEDKAILLPGRRVRAITLGAGEVGLWIDPVEAQEGSDPSEPPLPPTLMHHLIGGKGYSEALQRAWGSTPQTLIVASPNPAHRAFELGFSAGTAWAAPTGKSADEVLARVRELLRALPDGHRAKGLLRLSGIRGTEPATEGEALEAVLEDLAVAVSEPADDDLFDMTGTVARAPKVRPGFCPECGYGHTADLPHASVPLPGSRLHERKAVPVTVRPGTLTAPLALWARVVGLLERVEGHDPQEKGAGEAVADEAQELLADLGHDTESIGRLIADGASLTVEDGPDPSEPPTPAPSAYPRASDPCDCDLRNRQWDPNTGRCRFCGRAYVDPRDGKPKERRAVTPTPRESARELELTTPPGPDDPVVREPRDREPEGWCPACRRWQPFVMSAAERVGGGPIARCVACTKPLQPAEPRLAHDHLDIAITPAHPTPHPRPEPLLRSALAACRDHLEHRDRMNAVMHLGDVRWSPLTVMVQEALRA